MKRNRKIFLIETLILLFVYVGCINKIRNIEQYKEIPSMLNVLTNKAQIAVEDGVFNAGGEPAVIEYLRKKNSNVLNWFTERNYELKIGVIADTAVVLVCDQNKPIYEDTYCKPGTPDRNHSNSSSQPCEITMSEIDIARICN